MKKIAIVIMSLCYVFMNVAAKSSVKVQQYDESKALVEQLVANGFGTELWWPGSFFPQRTTETHYDTLLANGHEYKFFSERESSYVFGYIISSHFTIQDSWQGRQIYAEHILEEELDETFKKILANHVKPEKAKVPSE